MIITILAKKRTWNLKYYIRRLQKINGECQTFSIIREMHFTQHEAHEYSIWAILKNITHIREQYNATNVVRKLWIILTIV